MPSLADRRRPYRLRRAAAVVAALAAIGALTAGTSRAEVYAPPSVAPAAPDLTAPALTSRYAAVRDDIGRARATAERVRDGGRARALSRFLAPGRTFLSFDARGEGRAVEVVGDLARADRIAVVVPGADGSLTNFDSWKWAGGGARALSRQAASSAPGTRLAVVAWLGYASPSTRSAAVLTAGRAGTGARELRRFVTGLHRVNGRAGIGLLCHSYGTVVCAKAGAGAGRDGAPGLPVDEIALYGSPGTTLDDAAGLRTRARVWAGRSGGDWTRFVPKIRFAGLGFGRDPVSPAFGAARFDAGTGPHSAYLKPGSPSLRNLALIALARDSEVTHA
ncbi:MULTISPECIES: alpha/beta hydrolase [Actinomadura]|uniref:Alpha/beta hydrolase n=1 Tax=Actinomadura yumaensis TaxID=111807 RepID=A0ABW2CQP4_9ACTN|nr:alpha/beta hydrolase [Actinomadura sp. J1-007]MWK37586.1 hypothetical protein [Actinomadura sp. J1-007]